MIRRPPRSTRTDTLFPYTTLFRSLSVRRAETTFTMLQLNQPALRGFLNKPAGQPGSAPILGLSGYGPDRPIAQGDSEAAKKRNRRIDLRFLMTTPSAGLDKDILRQRQ